ncbi:MAG: bile acid:sodium symporter family protein [Succinivibrio sp.]|nr:bile acid:sodium symporter family protein [Succinivibrio sp.]
MFLTKIIGAAAQLLSRYFALWVVLSALLSYLVPELFTHLAAYIPLLLGLVMFGMGLTLKPSDFAEVLRRPFMVCVGILGQFVLMPLIAYLVCLAFALPDELAIGVILVGCCPGGTASNVMSYLARGDVSLSVTITACTTLLAPVVTPALIYLAASTWVEVSAQALFLSIVKVVLLPIALGVLLNVCASSLVRRLTVVLPSVSVLAIIAIVCAVVAVSRPSLSSTAPLLLLVVILHNTLGLASGYLLSRCLHLPSPACRTLCFEIGMQNSGLGVALAMAHFGPLCALPSALFSVWHNISGPLVAALFNRTKDARH